MKTIMIVTLILFNTKVFASCQSDTSKYCSQYDARVQSMFIQFCLWQNINKLSSSCKSGLISERDQKLKTKNTRQKPMVKSNSSYIDSKDLKESKSNKKRVSISELFKQYKKKQDQKKKNSSSNTRSNAKYTNTSSISYKKQLERIKKLIKEAHRNKEKYKTK